MKILILFSFLMFTISIECTELNSEKVNFCRVLDSDGAMSCIDAAGVVYLCEIVNNRPALCQVIGED